MLLLPITRATRMRMGEKEAMRRRGLTSSLYRAARLSNNVRPASREPGAYARRVVRRKTYNKSVGVTGRFLSIFGLK